MLLPMKEDIPPSLPPPPPLSPLITCLIRVTQELTHLRISNLIIIHLGTNKFTGCHDNITARWKGDAQAPLVRGYSRSRSPDIVTVISSRIRKKDKDKGGEGGERTKIKNKKKGRRENLISVEGYLNDEDAEDTEDSGEENPLICWEEEVCG